MQRSQPKKSTLQSKRTQRSKSPLSKTPKRSLRTKSTLKKVSLSKSPLLTTKRQLSTNGTNYKYLTMERKGATLVVTMNRPDLHNAFNENVISELTQAFVGIKNEINQSITTSPVADSNPSSLIRSVILTGAGPSFSAGADLSWMKSMSQYSEEQNKQDSLQLFDMFKSIYDCPVPVIARVNGVALGGGAGLVAVADIAVAIDTAKIGFTEVGIGLVPAVISRFCADKIGASQAARYFVTGERFSATEAKRIGLVHEVFSTMDEVDAQVNKLASIINNNSPNAVRGAKSLWKAVLGPNQSVESAQTRDFTTSTIAAIRVSAEGQAGLNSFLNKQSPPWKLDDGKKQ